MIQSTYNPKPVGIAAPAGVPSLRDLFHATPLYLFVAGAKAALASARRR